MKVYLGAPMRNYKEYNHPEMDRVTKVLRDHGYEVVNPAERDREIGLDVSTITDWSQFPPGFDMEEVLAWDFAAIEQASGVVFLPGWWDSEGCNKEYNHAIDKGRPVYLYTEAFGGFYLELIG